MAKAKAKKSPQDATVQAKANPWVDTWLALAAALVTWIVFTPALANEFVRWDDYELLVENPHYRGLGLVQLQWMFTTFHQGHYQPLSWITLGFDYLIWGMNPVGYHLSNITIHAAGAALFYLVAQLVLQRIWPAAGTAWRARGSALFAALFFAIHPLRVESVAWATERRDVLSGFFFLAAIYSYLKALQGVSPRSTHRNRWFYFALLSYALSLLAKASGVTLPLVLVLLDIYPLKRLSGKPDFRSIGRLCVEKWPFVLLALAAGILAPLAQSDAQAVASLRAHSLSARFAQSFYGLAFYLWKTLLPFDLSPFYEIPPRLDPWAWPFLLSMATVGAITIGLFVLRRRWPAGLTAWIYYIIVVAPVLGWVQSGRQLVADRYSYLSCLPWAIIIGALVFYRPRGDRKVALFSSPVALLTIALLGYLTVQQIGVWRNTDALWQQVLAVTDKSVFRSATAHHLVARFLAERGDLDGAIKHLRESMSIEPNDLAIYSDLGVMLGRQGRLPEATQALEKALAMDPQISASHFNLANALAMQGELSKAVFHLQEALRLRPQYVEAYHNLGKIHAAQGQMEKAIELFRRAIVLKPDFADARRSLVLALKESGRSKEAEQQMLEYQRVIQQTTPSS